MGRADSVHTRRWVTPFVERGADVTVIHAAAVPARRAWPGVRLIDLPASLNLPWVRYAVWAVYVRALLRQLRPSLLHAHCLDVSGWVAAAAGYHPLVVTVWGSDILLHPDRSCAARTLARWVLRRADAVTAPAEPLYERAVALAGQADKVRLIHWGVDCQVFRPEGESVELRASLGIPPDSTIVFCPRALAPVYDIETVLKTLATLAQTEPNVILLLLEFNARPDYREQIECWITQWGLRERVRLLPRVHTQQDMADLYRLATVVISLPLSDSLSLTVLESLACGTPVVVSDLRAYRGWVADGDVGFRVPVHDAESAADAVLSLLRAGENARLDMAAQGRARVVSRASLEQQMQAATDLYETLLSELGE